MDHQDREAPLGQITIERATAGEAGMLLALHEDVARWLWDQGIHQWQPGRFPPAVLDEWIARGEAYLAWVDGEPAGMIVLQEADESMWPGAPADALYIHGVRVRRAFAGRGVGREMLRWAAREALARGKAYLRLDVMADNPRIRAYYEAAGFVHVRDLPDHPWPASLYEQRVAMACGEASDQ
jgi:protein-tyrosine phosphatase